MEKDSKVKVARFGIASKGVVYSIAAILTIMAASGLGGEVSSLKDVFKFIQDQVFGQVLLSVLTLGLTCYVFWRFYQAIADPEDKQNNDNGTLKRIAYAISGITYGILTYSAIELLISSGSSGGGSSKKSMVATILAEPMGRWIVGLLALFLVAKAIYQLYRAYSGKFKEKIGRTGLDARARKIMLKTGKVGYTARGLVMAVISFFFFRAAFTANASKVGGTEKALEFIQSQSEWGTIVLAIVAFGLLLYGIFMFVKARYRKMGAVSM